MIDTNQNSIDKKKIKQNIIDFFQVIMSFALLFGIVVVVIFLVYKFSIFILDEVALTLDYVERLSKNGDLPLPLSISIITAVASIMTAILTTFITKNNELRLQIRTEQREKKALIYEELTEFFFKIIFAGKTEDKSNSVNPEMTEKETVAFLTSYTPKIIMWGSDEVLKQFYLFRNMALNLPSNSSQEIGGELIIQFEQLLFSIRRDLGHKNNKLKKGTILGLFINDLEKLF